MWLQIGLGTIGAHLSQNTQQNNATSGNDKEKSPKEDFKTWKKQRRIEDSCQAEEAEAEAEELWSEVKCSKLEKLYNTVPDRGIVSTQQQRTTTAQHSTIHHSASTAQYNKQHNNTAQTGQQTIHSNVKNYTFN